MIYLPLVALLIASFLTPLIGIKLKLLRRVLVTSALLFSFLFWIYVSPVVFSGKVLVHNMNEWAPPFGITLAVDSFSIVFLILVSGLGLVVSLIIEKFVKERRSEFYSLFLLVMVGMTGILITGDIFNIFIFTEIMVISCYGLAVFHRNEIGIEAGIKYILVGGFATSLILLGIALLYGLAGTLNMADLIVKINLKEALVPLGLIMSGYLVEIGSVPFHFWKPDVAQGVPFPLAATIVSVCTAAGIYALLRILFVFGALQLNYVLMGLGLVSMILGAFMALLQDDLRRLLAYSSVSQMGYILFAFSLGSMGFVAGLFHVVNNALLKMLLFLIIGSIIWRHGSAKPVNMPLTGACFLLASLGITGIPPLNGFASKLLIYEAGFQSGFALPTVLAIIISVITLTYYLKAFGRLFSGAEEREKEDKAFLFPILLLTALCIFLGLFPDLAIQVLRPAAESLLGGEAYYCSVFGC